MKYKLDTATYVIIASMVGTGVFASLFFQVDSLPSGGAILLLWLAGGLIALCGGLSYAELSGFFPRSGGEYEYLTRIYHPALGFSAGVCTLVVGFAAPLAGVALNLGNYFAPILGLAPDTPGTRVVAVGSILMVTAVQLLGMEMSARFQNVSTWFKIGLIALLIALPFCVPHTPSGVSFALDAKAVDLTFSGDFFSCLALLYYAYTGWNTSVYIASDVDDPKRTLPLSILIGIGVVVTLYVLLNYAFLKVCSFEEILAGGSSVGNTMIAKLFGDARVGWFRITDLFSFLMSLALLATLGSFLLSAPRVAEVFGKDYPAFQVLTRRLPNGAPHVAVLIMGGMAVLFTLLSDMRSILDYVGFSLSIFASLAVGGLYIMRWRSPQTERPFKAWGYPFTPFVFIALNLAAIYYSVQTMYGGNFLYGFRADGSLDLSPLSASVITIVTSMGGYFLFKRR
jgi:basic amino acid/polyamine antiporter, APA family